MFDQTMKLNFGQSDFSCLIASIILKQPPKILHSQETPIKKFWSLILDKKLFEGTHITNIVVEKHQGQTAGGSFSLVSKSH